MAGMMEGSPMEVAADKKRGNLPEGSPSELAADKKAGVKSARPGLKSNKQRFLQMAAMRRMQTKKGK